LIAALMGLHPWRKGPFAIGDVFIDTEWHSDWKWNRVAKHLRPLQGKTVLDVGCGSGYHCWRMAGAGAELVVGVDPSQKFLYQFQALKKYLGAQPVHLLPLRGEDLPKNLSGFDTVFSMGVLYHRKSPFDHLEELKAALRPGGELVLETLVIDGDENDILVPGERYSQMRNVWFIPSAKALSHWLERCGFVDVVVADINQTSIEEQRATDWMTFHSLENFLDPNDNNKTVEGYPAPKRATLIARKPN
jgi:tRNA (mo5U34)-methyltransferase